MITLRWIIAHSYEAVSVASKWSRFTAVSRDQIQDEAPEPGPNPGLATIRKHDFCVISTELYDNFLSLKCAIIAIKISHWELVQIYSLAEGVCCKASALAASALATNTYVSAVYLHQCSAADLNPYSKNLKNIWRRVVDKVLMNDSPSNIFLIMLSYAFVKKIPPIYRDRH